MRNVIEGDEFHISVERFGGYRIIDEILGPVIDSLVRNPYGFEKVENDFVSFRYVVTKAVGGRIPPLVFAFTINENKDVVLEWSDEIDEGEITD